MNLAAHAVAGAAFFVSIKPAPTNLCLLLCLVLVLLGQQTRNRLQQICFQPLGWLAFGFFALLALSQLYSDSTLVQANTYLSKYARLAYIPFITAALLTARDANRVLWAFLLGMLLTLGISMLNAISPGFCSSVLLTSCGPSSNPYVFKLHITHGYFMALAAGLCIWISHSFYSAGKSLWLVLLFVLLAVAAAGNVLFMVDGRTGWVVLLALFAVLFWRVAGIKGFLLAAVVVIALALGMYHLQPDVQQLVQASLQEYKDWASTGAAAPGSRSGTRLVYYSQALEAISQRPWFGYGLGGVEDAMALKGPESRFFANDNPHNQYLLFGLQIGLVGLSVYVAYFWLLIKLCLRNSPVPLLVWGFFVSFALANLFNSFHFDMSEAVFFAIAVAVFFALADEQTKIQFPLRSGYRSVPWHFQKQP